MPPTATYPYVPIKCAGSTCITGTFRPLFKIKQARAASVPLINSRAVDAIIGARQPSCPERDTWVRVGLAAGASSVNAQFVLSGWPHRLNGPFKAELHRLAADGRLRTAEPQRELADRHAFAPQLAQAGDVVVAPGSGQ